MQRSRTDPRSPRGRAAGSGQAAAPASAPAPRSQSSSSRSPSAKMKKSASHLPCGVSNAAQTALTRHGQRHVVGDQPLQEADAILAGDRQHPAVGQNSQIGHGVTGGRHGPLPQDSAPTGCYHPAHVLPPPRDPPRLMCGIAGLIAAPDAPAAGCGDARRAGARRSPIAGRTAPAIPWSAGWRWCIRGWRSSTSPPATSRCSPARRRWSATARSTTTASCAPTCRTWRSPPTATTRCRCICGCATAPPSPARCAACMRSPSTTAPARTVTLSRDPFGIKPLYVAQTPGWPRLRLRAAGAAGGRHRAARGAPGRTRRVAADPVHHRRGDHLPRHPPRAAGRDADLRRGQGAGTPSCRLPCPKAARRRSTRKRR